MSQIQEDALETYTHLSLHLDPTTKLLTSNTTSNSKLQELLQTINSTHNQFKTLDTPNHAPPPPLPINPKRTAQITKLRESGVALVRQNKAADSLRLFSLAIDMASQRPQWEPAGLVREELAQCYMDRANAHIMAQMWLEGWKDAECSAECKRGAQVGPQGQKIPGNPGAFALGGKCLTEMARWDDALAWLQKGVDIEGDDGSPASREMHRLYELAKSEVERREKISR